MANLKSAGIRLSAADSAQGTWGTESADTQIAVTHRFHVTIGGVSLGGWSKVSGLTVDLEPKPIAQAGVNTYTAQLLSRPKWSPIVLERAVTNADEWTTTFDYLIDSMFWPEGYKYSHSHPRLTINMLNAWGDALRTLHFHNARPSKWEGPTLDSNSGKSNVAIEKLSLVHDGFFADGALE